MTARMTNIVPSRMARGRSASSIVHLGRGHTHRTLAFDAGGDEIRPAGVHLDARRLEAALLLEEAANRVRLLAVDRPPRAARRTGAAPDALDELAIPVGGARQHGRREFRFVLLAYPIVRRTQPGPDARSRQRDRDHEAERVTKRRPHPASL